MGITVVSRRSALVLIDLQRGFEKLPTIEPFDEVVAKAGALASAFRSRSMPVVIVTVAGVAPGRSEVSHDVGRFPPGWTDVAPGLAVQPSDFRITKYRWGAFTGTPLEAYLRERDVDQIVLAGVATSIGVESTARHAYELGFDVTLAINAMTDVDRAAQDNSVAKIFPSLGETGTVDDVIALLDER